MTSFFPGSKAIAILFIGLGLLGLIVGFQFGWLYSGSFFHPFFLLIIGVFILIVEYLSDRNRTREPGTTASDALPEKDTNPNEFSQIQSMKFGGIGTFLIVGLLYLVSTWKIGPDYLWLSFRAYGDVAIGCFILVSLFGYYFIFKPR